MGAPTSESARINHDHQRADSEIGALLRLPDCAIVSLRESVRVRFGE